ncbi:MAG: [LysW]-aminoadipate kinase [Candidatus Micrarchaeota archaeon]
MSNAPNPSAKPLIVIKIGGSIGTLADAPAQLARDIAALSSQYSFIIVHGGASQTSRLSERLGIQPQFITSPGGIKSRYTNVEAIKIFTLALRGEINANLVLSFQAAGVNAVGLSGIDGRLLEAKQKTVISVDGQGRQKIIRDDFTGKVERVNGELLRSLLAGGYTPVIASLALGESSQPLNTDGDRAAAAIAREMRARKLVLMTDVDGYFRHFPNDLAPALSRSELDECMKNASGGMKRKLLASGEALDGGVPEAVIANGTKENPVSLALGGAGTHITIN